MPSTEDCVLIVWLGGIAGLLLVVWIFLHPAGAIELCISGNATGTGLHILEVAGPQVIGNASNWTIWGGM